MGIPEKQIIFRFVGFETVCCRAMVGLGTEKSVFSSTGGGVIATGILAGCVVLLAVRVMFAKVLR